MCELLAVSTSQPARLTFSLSALAARGAASGSSHDGWGVAFYRETDIALFREPAAAADSELVRYLQAHGPATSLAISHIRHATQGDISLANTHPFVRELGGRIHCFAHNGNLTGIKAYPCFDTGDGYRTVGETDSEHAFCALLSRLAPLWRRAQLPTMQARYAEVSKFAVDLARLGPANFLYADSDLLFAHGHRRLQAATGHAGPPGLWTLQRRCKPGQEGAETLHGLSVSDVGRSVVFVASVPLTDEAWRPLDEGEVIMVRHGGYVCTLSPPEPTVDF